MDELRESWIFASDEEQQALVELLFRPKFNPLDYLQSPSPEQVQQMPWEEQITAIEDRFCFLAADGMTVLRGQSKAVSYRQVLLQASKHLRLDVRSDFTTLELEAELFLNLLVQSWKKLPVREQNQLLSSIQNASPPSSNFPLGALKQDSVRLLLEGGSALAMSTVVRQVILKQFARQFTKHLAQRQLAKLALRQGGSAAAKLQSYSLAKLVGRGMATNAARYGVARATLGVVGPAMWAWFAADLGWRAIATNHPRIIPALYLLAQIRLSRADDAMPSCA